MLHWLKHASARKPAKSKDNDTARHLRQAAAAHRQMVGILVEKRQFDEALDHCAQLDAALATAVASAKAQGSQRGNEEIPELLQAAGLLEADVRWRMKKWEECFAVYKRLLDATLDSRGKIRTKDPSLLRADRGDVAPLSKAATARVAYRMGFIRLHRVFRRSVSKVLQDPLGRNSGTDAARRREVEAAADLVQVVLSHSLVFAESLWWLYHDVAIAAPFHQSDCMPNPNASNFPRYLYSRTDCRYTFFCPAIPKAPASCVRRSCCPFRHGPCPSHFGQRSAASSTSLSNQVGRHY